MTIVVSERDEYPDMSDRELLIDAYKEVFGQAPSEQWLLDQLRYANGPTA